MWDLYAPTQVGMSKETKGPIIPDDFRPVFGTRKEFAEDYIAKLELFIPHKQDDRIERKSFQLSMEHIQVEGANPALAMAAADYAAQLRWSVGLRRLAAFGRRTAAAS